MQKNEFYHLYNRGVDKRDIFLKREDYDRFMRLLYVCNGESEIRMEVLRTLSFSELLKMFSRRKPLVAIGAYCLMPNHFSHSHKTNTAKRYFTIHAKIDDGVFNVLQYEI